MAIRPSYGLVLALRHPQLQAFVKSAIHDAEGPLDPGTVGKLLQVAEQNPQIVMRPLHNPEGDPFYLDKPDQPVRRRMVGWALPDEELAGDPKHMIVIEETERLIDGQSVVVASKLARGPGLPVLGFVKSSCCANAPFSVFYHLDDGTKGFKDPVHGIDPKRPALFADGFGVMDDQALKTLGDLWVHLYFGSRKMALPSHNCGLGHDHQNSTSGARVFTCEPV